MPPKRSSDLYSAKEKVLKDEEKRLIRKRKTGRLSEEECKTFCLRLEGPVLDLLTEVAGSISGCTSIVSKSAGIYSLKGVSGGRCE